MRSFLVFLLISLSCRFVAGQTGEEALRDDTSDMRVAITLEKSEYFPGEEIAFTITVINPLRRIARVREPFHSNSGGAYFVSWRETGGWSFDVDHLNTGCEPCNGPFLFLQPQESRAFSLRTSKCGTEQPFFASGACGPNSRPGRYGITYLYGTQATSPFHVRPAAVQEVAYAALDNGSRDRETGKKLSSRQTYEMALVLRADEISYVVVGCDPTSRMVEIEPGAPLVGFDVYRLGKYRIVDESREEIRNLRVGSDSNGHIRLTYDRGNEKAHELQLGEDRRPIGARK